MMQSRKTTSYSQYTSLAVILVAALLIGLYPHIRYSGNVSGGGDAQRFTEWIATIQSYMSIVPEVNTYPNGYGYQVLVLVTDYLSGIELEHFQLYLGTLLMTWTVLLAWLFYRQITQSIFGASIATFILLTQPEFLFSLLRGTHEKFTRGLMFLCLFLLVRSILIRQQWRRFTVFLLAFYLTVYALITFNNLLATSFITALAFSLALSLFVQRFRGTVDDDGTAIQRRLLYATFVSLILAFFFTFYAYAPARQSILISESVLDRLSLLFLEVEETAFNPYQTISSAWISPAVYLLLSIANWLLLVASFVLWSIRTVSWWRNRAWPTDPRVLLLWSFYGAFGFMGALSIAVDISGAIAGNLQHRIFPTFAMIAAALVADWVVDWRVEHPLTRRLVYGVLAVCVAGLAILAVAKATNEPSLSNKWTYYTPAEFTALNWVGEANPETPVWTSFDERLQAAMGICCPQVAKGAQLDGFQPDPGTRNFLISDIIQARSQRLSQPLPIEGDSLRLYDNGTAEIYRLRPRTPFQK